MTHKVLQYKILVVLVAVSASFLLAEVGLRLFAPNFMFPHAGLRFSPRYHHASQEFSKQLKLIRDNPQIFKGDITVVILGDSFVVGAEVEAPLSFTSLMQSYYDSSPGPRIKIINLGYSSYSTMIYERLYRDVVLPLDPDVVIVCLDQTDVADDYSYEQELSSMAGAAGATVSNADFEGTILKNYESHPVQFFLLRHSQLFLLTNAVKKRLTGKGFIPENSDADARNAKKGELYLETCRNPAPYKTLFDNSEKYIRAMSMMKPARQKLYFVTYPRAENLAGQRKTTLLRGALPDSYASLPFFEYWIKKENLVARYPNVAFVHTSERFRTAIASTGLQYYFYDNDVHRNELGHRLFAQICERKILNNDTR